jgi:hypothetical protein
MRKRISEKEEDDFSFFNTQRIIEEEIENIYSTHRRRLFETHGTDFGDQVEWPYKTSRNNERESRIVLRSVVHEPSDKLKRLAVAYYRVAYSEFFHINLLSISFRPRQSEASFLRMARCRHFV